MKKSLTRGDVFRASKERRDVFTLEMIGVVWSLRGMLVFGRADKLEEPGECSLLASD